MLTGFMYTNKYGAESRMELDGQFIRHASGAVWAFASEADAQASFRSEYAAVLEDRTTFVLAVRSE